MNCRLTAAAALIIPCLLASGDVIRLTNGKELTGVVVEDTPKKVVLEVGVGTVTFNRSQVAAVVLDESAANAGIRTQWKRNYFDHDKYVPKGCEGIVADFRRLRDMRASLVEATKNVRSLSEKNRIQQRKFETLRSAQLQVSRRLKAASPDADPMGYNDLVYSNNSLHADMVLLHDAIRKGDEAVKASGAAVSAYFSTMATFRRTFSDWKARTARDASEDMAFLAGSIEGQLEEFDGEFEKHSVALTRQGRTLLVKATVNDRVDLNLLLDTGAALVSLTEDACRLLGLDVPQDKTTTVVLADGTKAAAAQVRLASLQVGDARAESIEALVMPKAPDSDIDGLLGMSFLRNFIVNINAEGSAMLMEKFQPK